MRLRVMRAGTFLAVAVAIGLVVPALVCAEIRVNDLDVYLNDQDVTVHVVLLGAVPAAFVESIQTGIPTNVRLTIELWRYNYMWRDTLVVMKQVERQLDYNVVTKEFRVTSVHGENRSPYATRDIRDAQRLLSEVHALKLVPAASIDPADVFYVRVLAETALRGEHTWVARVAGTAENTSRRSDYRTIMRVQ
jgi:uncharacterized protein DUF4390